MLGAIIFGWRLNRQKTIAHLFCGTPGAELSLCGLAARFDGELPDGDAKCKACKNRIDKIMSDNSSWPSEWLPKKARLARRVEVLPNPQRRCVWTVGSLGSWDVHTARCKKECLGLGLVECHDGHPRLTPAGDAVYRELVRLSKEGSYLR